MTGYIHSTDSFGTVDGPGIRYVVFFQGCPLRCAYCHNPDTWGFQQGKEVTVEELLHEYESYKEFLRNGGITATGGEPLSQPDFLLELFKSAKSKGIHTCLDTSGVTFNPENTAKIDEILSYTDLVMLDIKHMDSDKHKSLTGVGNDNILLFAEHLRDLKIPVWIRRVVVPNFTDNREELFRLGEFLATLSNLKALDVLPYHDMAKKKYAELKIEYPLPHTPPLSKEDAIKARDVIMSGIKSGLKNYKNQNYS